MSARIALIAPVDHALRQNWEAVLQGWGLDVAHDPAGPRSRWDAHGALLLGWDRPEAVVEYMLQQGWDYGLDMLLTARTPVLALGTGMAALFTFLQRGDVTTEGLGQWPGTAHEVSWDDAGAGPEPQSVRRVPLHAGLPVAGMAWPHTSMDVVDDVFCTQWELEPHGAFVAVAPAVTWSEGEPKVVVSVDNGPLKAAATPASPQHLDTAALVRGWCAAGARH